MAYSYYYDPAKDCHTDPVHLMDFDKAQIFAGSRAAVAERYNWAMTVACTDYPAKFENLIAVNAAAKKIVPAALYKFPEVPALSIDWGDHEAPSLPIEWWAGLTEWLFTLNGPVAFYCLGGHGRTGTALAILAGLSGLVGNNDDPVAWVHEHYCKKACESQAQLDYIEEITGLEVRVKPSGFGAVVNRSWPGYPNPDPNAGKNLELWEPYTDAKGKIIGYSREVADGIEWATPQELAAKKARLELDDPDPVG